MTEDEAKGWVTARYDALTIARLEAFVALVVEENDRQNLVSPASLPMIWARHVVDSLQLRDLAQANGPWLDVGTGGGFPGMAIAIAGGRPIALVEPRRRRAEFLQKCVDRLDLRDATVFPSTVERVRVAASVISARAVASIEKLLHVAAHCGTPTTQWLLPRGSVDRAEFSAVAQAHGMMFHVKQSITHPGSSIVVLTGR